MKYTRTVREYCDKHKKEMLEIAKVKTINLQTFYNCLDLYKNAECAN